MKQLLLDIQPPATPTLENFVVGRNAEALHSIDLLLSSASDIHFIYLWGEPGSGKTHLISACKTANVHTICVDDVQLFDNAAQIDLFNIYNQMRENIAHLNDNASDDSISGKHALIVTGNAAPTQMGLRDDLATRLAWGLTYQLHTLTDDEKALALLNHAHARGMRLPVDVISYCLRNLRRDLPTLISTINALDEWSLTTKKPITVPMLRQLLQLNLEI
jgi:DnaA family protein